MWICAKRWTGSRSDRYQEEAAVLLGVCARTFRRYVDRYEEDGLDGLCDQPSPGLERASFSCLVSSGWRAEELYLGEEPVAGCRGGEAVREARGAPQAAGGGAVAGDDVASPGLERASFSCLVSSGWRAEELYLGEEPVAGCRGGEAVREARGAPQAAGGGAVAGDDVASGRQYP